MRFCCECDILSRCSACRCLFFFFKQKPAYGMPISDWRSDVCSSDLSIAHRYVFTVYALDVAELPFEGRFTGGDAIKAIQGHVLAQASIMATYSLNPSLDGQL